MCMFVTAKHESMIPQMSKKPILSEEYITEHDAPIAKLHAIKNQIDAVVSNRAGSGRVPSSMLELWASQIEQSIKSL